MLQYDRHCCTRPCCFPPRILLSRIVWQDGQVELDRVIRVRRSRGPERKFEGGSIVGTSLDSRLYFLLAIKILSVCPHYILNRNA